MFVSRLLFFDTHTHPIYIEAYQYYYSKQVNVPVFLTIYRVNTHYQGIYLGILHYWSILLVRLCKFKPGT